MKTEDFTIRINLEDWKELKRLIRPYPKESVANYFHRVVNRLEIKLNQEVK